MILEVAMLDIRPGLCPDFERAFDEAQAIISAQAGYIGHRLERCLENDHRYLLLVEWETLEAHTEGFRGSSDYLRWKTLLHDFYDPFPVVEHYETLYGREPTK